MLQNCLVSFACSSYLLTNRDLLLNRDAWQVLTNGERCGCDVQVVWHLFPGMPTAQWIENVSTLSQLSFQLYMAYTHLSYNGRLTSMTDLHFEFRKTLIYDK